MSRGAFGFWYAVDMDGDGDGDGDGRGVSGESGRGGVIGEGVDG